MIIRNDYINKIKELIDVKVVKILCGIRRCGKSTILEMLKNQLISNGVDLNHIIVKKYTDEDFDVNYSSKRMFDDIKINIIDEKNII